MNVTITEQQLAEVAKLRAKELAEQGQQDATKSEK